METSKVLVSLLLLSTLHFLDVSCTKFEVGGDDGWKVPKSKEEFNHWASKNRFKVDDTVHFNYSKDSVMVVTEEEYDKCKSERPIFYSKDGSTDYKLDRPGLFYFMSGVKGHCEKGQRMIIKVLEIEPAGPPQPAAMPLQTNKSAAAGIAVSSATLLICFVLFVGVLCSRSLFLVVFHVLHFGITYGFI